MPDNPRLRGRSGSHQRPWPIGQIPDEEIREIGKQLVLKLAIGEPDITGDAFGDIFAVCVEGIHYSSPLGLADVAFNGTGWSVKTVKATHPHDQKKVRLISGRNSPDYSMGINDPHANIQDTGAAVLAIWNSRLNAARGEHDDIRVAVLIRNMSSKEFVIFEEEVSRYAAGDYEWKYNANDNLQGHRKTDGTHCFTWQFHGSQFTVIRDVLGSATAFRINRSVPLVEAIHVERMIKHKDDWIEIG